MPTKNEQQFPRRYVHTCHKHTHTTLLQHDSTQTKNQATTGCPLANNHADVVRRHEYAGKDYDTPANFRN